MMSILLTLRSTKFDVSSLIAPSWIVFYETSTSNLTARPKSSKKYARRLSLGANLRDPEDYPLNCYPLDTNLMPEFLDLSFSNTENPRQETVTGSVYKIGDLAREFDVTLRTLRFYEDRGLITPTRSGTTRLYSSRDRERLRIALFCKRIGLSLGEIHEVLMLHDSGSHDVDARLKIKAVFASQLEILQKQQREMIETISDLQRKLDTIDA